MHNSTDKTIPKTEAITYTGHWRRFYADAYNAYPPPAENATKIEPNDEKVFRSFRVSLDDLRGIMGVIERYNSSNPSDKINSIRVYLAKNAPDLGNSKDMHVLLVPVVGGDPMANDATEKYGKDLLEFVSPANVIVSTIYDFSTPCPDQCDVTSPLYK